MADSLIIDPARVARLRDPQRLEDVNPELVWRTIEPQSDAVIIDVGAGVGFLTLPFAQHYPQAQIYACDILPGMLELLKESAAAESLSNINCLRMEDTTIPLPDQFANLVMMLQVHHELTDPQSLLTDCHRVLKPGGVLAIIDWKDEDNGKSPPPGRRVPEPTMRTQMAEASFTQIQSYPLYVYHNFLTGKADTTAN
jgi:ubiquinone/menaquinone biosynthesis C-methylase UbiE